MKFYNAGKGYGFVVPGDGGRDVFLHGSALNGPAWARSSRASG